MTIYTDGSFRRKENMGGLGIIVLDKDNNIIDAYSEQTVGTTSNREEMKAILWALENYGVDKNEFFYPIVYSDSAYAVNSFSDWIWRWKYNNWTRGNGQPVENLDLIKKYDIIYTEHKKRIKIQKVKGHADNKFNNLADLLATGKIKPEDCLNGRQLYY